VKSVGEKLVTRAVTIEDVADLLDSPPRAHIAYVVDGQVDAGPARFQRVEGRYFMLPPYGVDLGARISLLIDAGMYNSELRGVRINGTLGAPESPPADLAEGALELLPSSVTAWDYGAMRRAGDAS
jgi:hypothetical protein